MSDTFRLEHFLEKIMQISVMHMEGAGAGIIGSSDANSDVVNSLKRSTIAFAQEYRKQEPNQNELKRASEQVSGYLQTLQIINALSENTVAAFIDELGSLMEKVLV